MNNIEWNNLWIGSSLSLFICLTGGNAAEQIKVVRQSSGYSYYSILTNLINKKGYFNLFYRGYFPWGILQSSTKGLPILFVPSKIKRILLFHNICSENKAVYIGGCLGGVCQGLITTPTQRLKTLAYTNNNSNNTDYKHIIQICKERGINTIMRGYQVLMLRRGLDWGFRYYGMTSTLGYLKNNDITENDLKNKNFKYYTIYNKLVQNIIGGLSGGLLSTVITTPLDTIISKHQSSCSKHNIINTVSTLYSNGRFIRLYRGFGIRLLFASYSTFIIIGGGELIYNIVS